MVYDSMKSKLNSGTWVSKPTDIPKKKLRELQMASSTDIENSKDLIEILINFSK